MKYSNVLALEINENTKQLEIGKIFEPNTIKGDNYLGVRFSDGTIKYRPRADMHLFPDLRNITDKNQLRLASTYFHLLTAID